MLKDSHITKHNIDEKRLSDPSSKKKMADNIEALCASSQVKTRFLAVTGISERDFERLTSGQLKFSQPAFDFANNLLYGPVNKLLPK